MDRRRPSTVARAAIAGLVLDPRGRHDTEHSMRVGLSHSNRTEREERRGHASHVALAARHLSEVNTLDTVFAQLELVVIFL